MSLATQGQASSCLFTVQRWPETTAKHLPISVERRTESRMNPRWGSGQMCMREKEYVHILWFTPCSSHLMGHILWFTSCSSLLMNHILWLSYGSPLAVCISWVTSYGSHLQLLQFTSYRSLFVVRMTLFTSCGCISWFTSCGSYLAVRISWFASRSLYLAAWI